MSSSLAHCCLAASPLQAVHLRAVEQAPGQWCALLRRLCPLYPTSCPSCGSITPFPVSATSCAIAACSGRWRLLGRTFRTCHRTAMSFFGCGTLSEPRWPPIRGACDQMLGRPRCRPPFAGLSPRWGATIRGPCGSDVQQVPRGVVVLLPRSIALLAERHLPSKIRA